MKGKRGQAVFEFVVWIGLSMMIGIFLLYLFSGNLSDQIDKKKDSQMNQLADNIRDELVLASDMNNGYIRNITIPTNDDYTLNATKSYLTIDYDDKSLFRRVPKYTGTITKGNLTIKKINEEIIITQN